MQEVIIFGIVMSIPIIAILSSTFLKFKRMEIENTKLSESEKRILVDSIKKLSAENEANKQQNLQLETRITDLEKKLLLSESVNYNFEHPYYTETPNSPESIQ